VRVTERRNKKAFFSLITRIKEKKAFFITPDKHQGAFVTSADSLCLWGKERFL
jgi:hypothetical protein